MFSPVSLQLGDPKRVYCPLIWGIEAGRRVGDSILEIDTTHAHPIDGHMRTLCASPTESHFYRLLLLHAGAPSPDKVNVQVLSKELKAHQAAVPLPAARDQSAALFRNMSIH